MTNYQLYRTNVLLGGQMKYDLIVDNGVVNDIHITPISESAPYNRYVKDNLLNYAHQENISRFYKKTSSTFFSDCVNPELTSIYPLYNEYKEDTDVTMYEMGCRRAHYQLYNKQFEFFCPVWLEKIENIKDLKFEFQAALEPDKPLYTQTISFNDRIAKYFQDYIEFIQLNKGCDWVFNINKSKSLATGINVQNGLCENIFLFNLYNDLIHRERPVLEVNNMITNELSNHQLIAKQLFNFNFCFNLQDILDDYFYRELNHVPIYINIVIKNGSEILEMRDIFSNHEYINKFGVAPAIITTDSNDEIILKNESIEDTKEENNKIGQNVLDYLNDDKYVEFTDKNKIIQNTCHWCLSNNPEEHFNLYDGFSLYNSNGHSIPYYNGETTNLHAVTFTNEMYPYWCNNYKLTRDNSEANEIISHALGNHLKSYFYLYSKFYHNCWVKNVNYKLGLAELDDDNLSDNSPIISEDGSEPKGIKVLVLQLDDYVRSEFLADFKQYSNWESLTINMNHIGDKKETKIINVFCTPINHANGAKIIILMPILDQQLLDSEELKYFLYKKFKSSLQDELKQLEDKTLYLNTLKDFLVIINCPSQLNQTTLLFENGLKVMQAYSPSLNSKEVTYYKDVSHKTLIRSFGKIKPYFIKADDNYKNYHYKKLKYKEVIENGQEYYPKYSNSKYLPKFPSINYFAFSKGVKEKYKDKENIQKDNLEFHNYVWNKIYNLIPYIELNNTFSETDNNVKYIDEFIKTKLKEYYVSRSIKDKDIDYILGLYEWEYNFVDKFIENGKWDYQYLIRIKLK